MQLIELCRRRLGLYDCALHTDDVCKEACACAFILVCMIRTDYTCRKGMINLGKLCRINFLFNLVFILLNINGNTLL